MKNNKTLKILWSIVGVIFVGCVVFLGYNYFASGSTSNENKTTNTKNNTSQTENKTTSENKDKTSSQDNTQNTAQKEEQANNNVASDQTHKNNQNNQTNTPTENKTVVTDDNVITNKTTTEYNGKKISQKSGVGSTGKVFDTQKEALEYGNAEIERLVKEDKKPRQFSISKVTAEDGSLVGWTVDIFEGSNSRNDS